ncbi:MAG: hypothetical protein AAFX50_04250 [Acidobacteriota bacterium]
MPQLDSILSLHTTLVELDDARRRLGGVPDWMAELHQEYSGRKALIDAEEEAVASADKERRDAEGEVRDAQDKLEKYQSQISQVTTQREYGALLKEIDTVKEQIKAAEEAALQALQANEEATEKATSLRVEFSGLEARYKDELRKWEEEKPSVEAREKELEASVADLREKVPKGLLALYERLYKSTKGEAVAEVRRIEVGRGAVMWHCKACHYNVRPQLLVEIRGGGIQQCESCKRILYWRDEE